MTFEALFGQLTEVAASRGLGIYNVCFRRAGVGIMWCDQEKLQRVGQDRYKESLVVHRYYETLREAVEGELERLEKQHQSVEG